MLKKIAFVLAGVALIWYINQIVQTKFAYRKFKKTMARMP